MWRWVVALALVAAVVAAPNTRSQLSTVKAEAQARPDPERSSLSATDQARRAYEQLPLTFIPNAGQTDAQVRFEAHAGKMGFWFTRSAAVLATRDDDRAAAVRLEFVGASTSPELVGEGRAPGVVNYFVGNDPRSWRSDLPMYEAVRYDKLWPGVDLVFRGAPGRLKYELEIGPNASVSAVRLAYAGAGLSLAPDGSLLASTSLGVLRDEAPLSYQTVDGRRVPVESRFVLEDEHTYGFSVGPYDHTQTLVIDPGLVYSTFLGGTSADEGRGVAVDTAGNAYITGATSSANFPVPLGFDTSFNSGQDVFVTKLNAAGTAIVYSTFLGGSSNDQGFAIAVDADGSAYVTGSSGSTNFPMQSALPPFVYQPFYRGGSTDAFVTKLSPSGTALVYSTYFGGIGADEGLGIAVFPGGDTYVTGDTTSSNLWVTPLALKMTLTGASDGFFLRLDRFAAGAGYTSYLGGSADDAARAIAIDGARNVFLTGGTTSSNFPTSAGAFDTTPNGGEDAFAMRLTFLGGGPSLDNYAIGYSTFLGGGGLDRGLGIALAGAGEAFVTGISGPPVATSFPVTPGAFQTAFGGGTFDAFVTRLNIAGSAPLLYSTLLGGTGDDRGAGIAVAAAGVASIAGRTSSSNFPTTPGAFDTSWNLGDDAFVAKFGSAGSLMYSTFLGGSSGPNGNNDRGQAIALDPSGAAYVTGLANADNFPVTPGAYDTTHNGNADAFVTKLVTVGAPTTLTLAPATDTNEVGTPHSVTATATDYAAQPVAGVTVRFTVTGVNPTSGAVATGGSGQATFTYTGTIAGTDTISAFADTNGNTTQDSGEPGATATKTWTPGPPATLALTPATATNVVGTPHCVTATVRDQYGNVVPGVTVVFSVTNVVGNTVATPSSGAATTSATGQAQYCFTALLAGTNSIHAFADTNTSGAQDPDEPGADATKIWILPTSTAGCRTNLSGWIITNDGDKATFDGSIRVSNDGSQVRGAFTYQDHGPVMQMHVEATSILAMLCASGGGSATIWGTATIDGAGSYSFRIDVTDGGAGGSGDTFGILLSTGYTSGQQPLGGGDIKIAP